MSAPTIKRSLARAIGAFKRDVETSVMRSASHAGALVLYDEMKLRAPVSTGRLRDSIYRWHDDDAARLGAERYLIGPNKRKAPHWGLIEYGHWRVNKVVFQSGRWVFTTEKLDRPEWVPAVPYIRPTFDAKSSEAFSAAKRRLKDGIRESMKSVRSRNG